MKVERFLIDLDGSWNSHDLKISSVIVLFVMLSVAVVHCENRSNFSLIFSGGANYGCLVPKEPIDGVSGASKWGGNGGVHAEIGIAGHFIETGFDYSYFKNDLSYLDTDKSIDGTRSLTMHSMAIPIMYNFHLSNREAGDPNLIVGIGLLASYSPYQVVRKIGTLPDYSSSNWAVGPCLRISFYPLEIEGKYYPGLYLGLFRSISRFYTDDYYKDKKAGVWGILDIGISLKMKL
jgi:hypothetical protein